MWNLQTTYRDIKNQLQNILKELSFSDLAHVALIDARGELIHVEGDHPLHYFGFSQTVPTLQKYFKLSPGDVLVTNDSAFGSPRLCDLNFIAPIYRGKEIKAYGVIQISWIQLLNAENLFMAFKADDEGYKIPPTPLDPQGTMEVALENYLRPSGLDPKLLIQTFKAARTCLKKLEASYHFFESKWGRGNEVQNQFENLQKYTEKLMRDALHRFPDGEYTTSQALAKTCEGETGVLQTQFKIQGSTFSVNFLGTSKASSRCLNLSYHLTLSSCMWFFMSYLGDEVPVNSGILKALAVEAPIGTLVNAPATNGTLGGYYMTSYLILAQLKTLLAKTLPRDAEECMVTPSLTAAIKIGPKLYIENYGSGTGGRAQRPGVSCVKSDFHNTPVKSVEAVEQNFELVVESQSLRLNREKSETHMGGRGLSLTLVPQNAGQICVYAGLFRDEQEVVLVSKEGKNRSLKLLQPVSFVAEDKIQLTTFNGYNFELSN